MPESPPPSFLERGDRVRLVVQSGGKHGVAYLNRSFQLGEMPNVELAVQNGSLGTVSSVFTSSVYVVWDCDARQFPRSIEERFVTLERKVSSGNAG